MGGEETTNRRGIAVVSSPPPVAPIVHTGPFPSQCSRALKRAHAALLCPAHARVLISSLSLSAIRDVAGFCADLCMCIMLSVLMRGGRCGWRTSDMSACARGFSDLIVSAIARASAQVKCRRTMKGIKYERTSTAG